jgi:hypothetical protein
MLYNLLLGLWLGSHSTSVLYNLHLDSEASHPHMFIISGEIAAKRGIILWSFVCLMFYLDCANTSNISALVNNVRWAL